MKFLPFSSFHRIAGPRASRIILTITIASLTVASTKAGTITESSGTDLTSGATWTGGIAPGFGDIAQWISTSSGGTSETVNSNVNWGAMDFEGAAAAVTIGGTGTITLSGGQTINSTSNAGIVLGSGANGAATTINVAQLTLGASQVWTAASAKNLLISSSSTLDLGGFTLDLNITGTLGANNNFSFAAAHTRNGTINVDSGNIVFANAGTSSATATDSSLTVNINSGANVRYSNTSTYSFANALGLNGGKLLFSNGPTLSGVVSVSSDSTISNQLSSASATATLSGPISGSSNLAVTSAGGSSTYGLTLTNANSSYSGGWTLSNSSTLTIGTGGGLGDGSSTNSVTLNGTSTTLAFTGASGSTTVASVISGTGKVTKSGAGTVVLSGSNSYTGTTTVSAGTLLVNGSLNGSAVTVKSGSTFGSQNTSGLLAVGGGLNLNSGGHLTMAINGTTILQQYAPLSVGGPITLGGDLQLSLGYTPQVGDTFYVIINHGSSAISGAFSNAVDQGNGTGLITAGGDQFLVSYTASQADGAFTEAGGQDVALQVISIPEPGAVASLLGGFGMLAGLQRFRRRQMV